jgi:hypothetical protein
MNAKHPLPPQCHTQDSCEVGALIIPSLQYLEPFPAEALDSTTDWRIWVYLYYEKADLSLLPLMVT